MPWLAPKFKLLHHIRAGFRSSQRVLNLRAPIKALPNNHLQSVAGELDCQLRRFYLSGFASASLIFFLAQVERSSTCLCFIE